MKKKTTFPNTETLAPPFFRCQNICSINSRFFLYFSVHCQHTFHASIYSKPASRPETFPLMRWEKKNVCQHIALKENMSPVLSSSLSEDQGHFEFLSLLQKEKKMRRARL